MNITIARLRSFVKYEGPLETVLDSFFENYVKWMKANPQHNYDTYNCSFDGTRPKRTPETIEWADVIINYLSSIVYDAYYLNKIFIYPSHFNENTMIWEKYNACWKVSSTNGFQDCSKEWTISM